ncbi:MAG: N-glycosylase/DNA lyase [Nanoarchaeota archaeon]|nr:N-glycosylase/DNA lyase [Nanoarchaeota archaeon]
MLLKMRYLLDRVRELNKAKVKEIVNERIREFKSLGKKSKKEIFKELCFCILTANYSAAGGIRIQREIGDDFLTLTEKQLAKRLKELGHRFPNTRARYIIEARKKLSGLKLDRDWLVKNIRGLGMKESSHFLRNIGFDDFAIIDFHIIDILERSGLIKRPKTLTKKRYLEIEDVLRKLAKKLNLTLAELDLYLWYLETGKILK